MIWAHSMSLEGEWTLGGEADPGGGFPDRDPTTVGVFLSPEDPGASSCGRVVEETREQASFVAGGQVDFSRGGNG